MHQKYELFIGDFYLIWADSTDFSPTIDSLEVPASKAPQLIRRAFSQSLKGNYHILSSNPEVDMKEAFGETLQIDAAGGIVRDPTGRVLLIQRLGRWDLPKGKLEKGEGIEEAALREVEEECGIRQLLIETQLPRTWHGYDVYGEPTIKCTHWFAMKTTQEQKAMPQTEEDITEAVWQSPELAAKNLAKSYPAIRSLAKVYFSELY